MAVLKSFGKACIVAFVVGFVKRLSVSAGQLIVYGSFAFALFPPAPINDFSLAKFCTAGSFLLAERTLGALCPAAR